MSHYAAQVGFQPGVGSPESATRAQIQAFVEAERLNRMESNRNPVSQLFNAVGDTVSSLTQGLSGPIILLGGFFIVMLMRK